MVLVRGDVEVATWLLLDESPPNLALIDALARLQLAALRLGCSVRLRDAPGPLRELLDLVGLAGTLGIPSVGAALVVEVAGDPERGEQVGIQEAVEPGNPVA